MARLKCTACGAGVSKSDPVCRGCGSPLFEDGATVLVEEGATVLVEEGATGLDQEDATAAVKEPVRDRAPSRCPTCDAVIPDPRHLVCVECMTELQPDVREPAVREAAVPPAIPRADEPPGHYATVHEQDGARLVVSFAFGEVELCVGQEVLLGRDATDQRLAHLDALKNVSRRHATIGLAPRGAWVRDEKSTNGTFVDERPVRAGETVDLAEGTRLRLASDVQAIVRFRRPGDPGDPGVPGDPGEPGHG